MPSSNQSEATTPSIGVIIVTYNSADVIEACLDGLVSALAGHEYTVVVVDNDSSDESVRLAHAHPVTTEVVETGRNAGYAAGINAGRRVLGTTDTILVLNPDCRLRHDALRHLVDALSPTVGVAAPRLVNHEGQLAQSIHRSPTVRGAFGAALLGDSIAGRIPGIGEAEFRKALYAHQGRVDWASGAALLVSSECFDAVGDWDERFFLYSEETDFQLRAADAGFEVWYVPAAVGRHRGGDSPVSSHLWTILTLNRVRLHRKRHGRVQATAYLGAVILGETLRVLRGRRASRRALKALVWPPARPARVREPLAECRC